ncbi:MAG: hypothetical protein GC190_07345 [Alphaproteobacteria bacterium]|nr:hypothetical protein [Alphaproteobacteria bacterium]
MRGITATIGLFLGLSGVAQAATCGSDTLTGRFDGISQGGFGKVEVTLNLLCDKGEYVAQMFTSIGDLKVSEASATADHVRISFDTGASLATAELSFKDGKLSGEVVVAGSRSTMDLTKTGPALGRNEMQPRLDLTKDQWRADIDAFAVEVPKRHANAFFTLPRATFDGEIAALRRDVDHLNDDQIFTRLYRIANMIGDGHTGIVFPHDRRVIPIEIGKFGDDFRIISAGPGLDDILGTRIQKIGDIPIAEAWRRAMTLTPQGELAELREGRAIYYLVRGITLHGLDITPSRDHATYTVVNDEGRVWTVDLKAVSTYDDANLHPIAVAGSPLRLQDPDKPFWCKAIGEQHAVYCAWHAYQNLKAGAAEMFALVDQAHPAKLIIDMRDNGGGDNTEGDRWLVKPLKARADLNIRGKLFVLIGPLTFSAAMNNAAQFSDETNATLVGETIGERPNSYQEPRQFRLPNSHLVVRVSTLFYTFRKTGENAVRPNKEIIPTWEDVKAGRDPVLDWVFAQPPK